MPEKQHLNPQETAHIMKNILGFTPRLAASLAAASLAVAACFAAAPGATDTDKAFVAKVSQGGAYEVMASKFALAHAHAQDVIDLANAEVHDHTLVGAKLKSISAAAALPIAPSPNADFADRFAKLKAAAGPNFDAAYIDDMKSIHDKDQALFAQEAKDGSGAFQAFAAETDRIVKRHQGTLAVNP